MLCFHGLCAAASGHLYLWTDDLRYKVWYQRSSDALVEEILPDWCCVEAVDASAEQYVLRFPLHGLLKMMHHMWPSGYVDEYGIIYRCPYSQASSSGSSGSSRGESSILDTALEGDGRPERQNRPHGNSIALLDAIDPVASNLETSNSG